MKRETATDINSKAESGPKQTINKFRNCRFSWLFFAGNVGLYPIKSQNSHHQRFHESLSPSRQQISVFRVT